MDTTRVRNGTGPEVTIPEWGDRDPTPAELVTWFLEQSREAQESVAEYHLSLALAVNKIQAALIEEGLNM